MTVKILATVAIVLAVADAVMIWVLFEQGILPW